jgi:hypothetical protein
MSHALVIPVQESTAQLRLILKSAIPFLQPRIKLLLVLKKYDNIPVSKRELMEQTGLCSYSVHKWRTMYLTGGIEGLLKHNKTGFKPSKISAADHLKLKAKLNDPENGIRGYKELQEWVAKELNNPILYNTLLKYCVKHFGSKIKVARKYHAKKDNEAVNTFKKTLRKPVKKQLR